MTDLQKRCDTYINLDNADPRAIGLIAELRAHLRAANKGAESANKFAHESYQYNFKIADRVTQLEHKIGELNENHR